MNYTRFDCFIDAMKVWFVTTMVLLAGIMFGDASTEPISAVLGATAQQIKECSNTYWLQTHIGLFVFMEIGLFALAYLMLGYLNGPLNSEEIK